MSLPCLETGVRSEAAAAQIDAESTFGRSCTWVGGLGHPQDALKSLSMTQFPFSLVLCPLQPAPQ